MASSLKEANDRREQGHERHRGRNRHRPSRRNDKGADLVPLKKDRSPEDFLDDRNDKGERLAGTCDSLGEGPWTRVSAHRLGRVRSGTVRETHLDDDVAVPHEQWYDARLDRRHLVKFEIPDPLGPVKDEGVSQPEGQVRQVKRGWAATRAGQERTPMV